MTIEAEQAVLGVILQINDAYLHASNLSVEDFEYDGHRKLFQHIIDSVSKGQPCNIVTAMHACPTLEKRYIIELTHAAGGVLAIDTYSTIVIESASKRRLLSAAREVVGSPDMSPSDMLQVLSVALNEAVGTGPVRNRKITEGILEGITNKMEPQSTGILQLNEAMGGGLYPSKAYGFAGVKKMGKTILASTLSENLNQFDVPHMFICAEMGAAEIHERCLSRRMNAYPSAFRVGNKRPFDFIEKLAYEATHEKNNVYYVDAPGITLAKLKQMVALGVLRHKMKGFILDYWQLVGGAGKMGMTAHLDEVAQWIAVACKQYKIWAIVTAQINQEGNTRGGEGIRLAFDQVYQLKAPQDDPSYPQRWLEMMDTRYTAWLNVGSENSAGLLLNEKGPFFEQVE